MTHARTNSEVPAHGDEAEGPSAHEKLANHSAHAEEHEEGEPWLLSYADMVTLLMCFFILFFSIDKSKGGIADPKRLQSKLESVISVDAALLESSAPPGSPKPSARTVDVKRKIGEDLKHLSKSWKIAFSLTTPAAGLVEVTFLNANFFQSGRAEMTARGAAMIRGIAPRLVAMTSKPRIEIEGHTDTDQVVGNKFPSNWELSAARAAAVARLLEARGFDPARIKIAGFAANKPLMPERDAHGYVDTAAKTLNRRVTIRIQMPEDVPASGKGGQP